MGHAVARCRSLGVQAEGFLSRSLWSLALLCCLVACGQASTPLSEKRDAGLSGKDAAGGDGSGGAVSAGDNAGSGGATSSGGATGQGGGGAIGGTLSSGGVVGRGGGGSDAGITASGGSSGVARTGGAVASGGAGTTGGAVSSGGAGTGGQTTSTATSTATTTVTATTTDTSTVADALYVAPNGKDSNPGTPAEPLYSLAAAVAKATAGSTIYMRGGTYDYGATIALAASGTATSPIRVWSYPNEIPVLDFRAQPYDSAQRGILLTGNFWHVKGIEICYAGDNGMKIEGSHNTIERCVFHHNGDSGLQLGFGHETANPDGELCSHNEIIDCDSYLNFDFDNMGSDADGFACKMHQGKGNVFRGCRAWRNSDDGWDLFETDWPVEISQCWTWHNGDRADFEAIYQAKMGKKMSSFQGNGNGFKLGGNGTGGDSKGTHVVRNCVSFDNNFASKKGFDQNSHKGGVLVQNCTAWGNGYNYMFETDPDSGTSNQFDNNVEFDHKGAMAFEFSSAAIQNNNSWQLPAPASAADFASLAESLALAPRQADGSLPVNDFARPMPSSGLVDRGKDVGLPFAGAAPDLGAFECR
ncbi:MAG: right-handed parallel beta-helix repeat-containing protein [Deltaproteobacteria bacterium]|nr:right-handed parallel beta-helix repeat-containing protein [Deltaproteobacteria bacterium]